MVKRNEKENAMSPIDLMVADEACQYTGMSHTELASAAHTRGFKSIRLRALPDVIWYLFADISALRGRGDGDQSSAAATETRPAMAKPAGRKAATKSIPQAAPEPTAPPAATEPAELPANADPYPIDPFTEAEELSRLSKAELTQLCGQLGIPEAANLFRRSQIARAIVDHKVKAWNARQAEKSETAKKVTPIRGKGRGRRETGTGKLLTAVGGGTTPLFSDGSN